MTQSPDTTPHGQGRDPDREASSAFGPERSFAPANETDSLPAQVRAFAEGRIDQARCGRVLMIAPRETEVGSHNWEPFARWLVGEVTAANAFKGALLLDLRRVDRLSSRGLRALAFGWRELAEGGVIAVCGLTPMLREIFAISQYDRLFEIYDDVAAAYRGVARRLRAQTSG